MEASVISNRNDSAQVKDDSDEREIELPACLDFPVRYGMGALIDDNGALTESFSEAVESRCQALFWPWRESMTVLDARYMRVELVGMVDELASLECWPRALLDAVVTAAVRAPLSALLPDTQHFRARLKEARAEAATRAILDWTLRTEHSNNWGQE